MPRRMWTSSSLSPARLARRCSRAISFLGAAGSRKPSVSSACLPVRDQAAHRDRVGMAAGDRRAPRRGEAALRLAPVVGDELHRLGEVERAVARIGRDRQAGVAGVDVVVRQAEALRAEDEGDPMRARRQRREQLARRAVRRAEVARRHRRRADPGDAVERVVEAGDDARAARARRSRRSPSRSPRGAACTSAKRGATRTRSEKPITFIARAAAPTLPAWLVPTRTKRVGSAVMRRLKSASLILQRAPSDPGPRPRAASSRKPDRSHVPSAAPHAQHRRQGGARGRGDHQPGLARPRAAAGQLEGAERLRHRGRPRRRGGDHRHPARRPTRATASSPRSRAATRGARDSEYVWIIDPLDGTTNFIHGLPTYAVSIGLAFRDQIQQAVVYDPARNDLFFASKGRGAFLNDKRLRVSKRTRMADALIGTGFPFRKGDDLAHYLRMLETVMKSCAGVRRPGAAALDLCYVAAGWYDGFFETGLSPWDVAAGSLIVTEAGGLVGNFTGEADFLHQREVVAGCPKIYGQLVQMLTPHTNVARGAADETAA